MDKWEDDVDVIDVVADASDDAVTADASTVDAAPASDIADSIVIAIIIE